MLLSRISCMLLLAAIAPWFVVPAADADALNSDADGGIVRMEQAGRYLDLRNHIERRLAEGVEPTATPLSYLCVAYGKLKQYAQLFDCFAKLERQIAAGDWKIQPVNHLLYDTPGDARPLLDAMKAEAALEFGDYRKAIAAGERALAEIPQVSSLDSPPFPPVKLRMSVLPILVISSVQAGETEQAKNFMEQLEHVETPFGGSGMWETLRSNGLGRSYMALGMYDKAIVELGAAREFSLVGGFANLFAGLGSTKKDDSFLTVYELPRQLMLGKAYAETGKLDKAKAALDGVLASPRAKEAGELYWLTLFERGRVAESEQDLSAAAKFYEAAVQVIEEQRATINTEANKIGFVGDKQALYGRLIGVLVAQGNVSGAFDYVERSKSRALVDMLAAKKDFVVQAADPEQVKSILSRLDLAGMAARAQEETSGPEQKSAARNLQVAQQEIASAAPELSALVTVSSVPFEELNALLGAQEVLVEYYYRGNDLYAFILDRKKLQVVKLNGKGLEEQVRSLREAINEANGDAWRAPAAALYARLWRPLEFALGTPESVLVVAHGILHYLPFAALQRPDGSFLIDHYGLRFLPSASVLKLIRPAPKQTEERMLVLGNPDLGDPALDLRFAESEARTVAGLFPGSRILLRKDASETNFREIGGAFGRIHFATHGKFQAENPLSSGLYLAKDAGNDGVLTVGELYSMNLNADLVTLSACETGLGKVFSGDDVVGLTRGFLYAGSRSIVASLWSVDDRATAALMKNFYTNLEKKNKEEALRQAQISARGEYPHPYYWAAFQLTGSSQ